jgi:hypothetical protein
VDVAPPRPKNLALSRGLDGLDAGERTKQALEVLKVGWPAGTVEGPSYECEHVLQLCHFQSFKEGLLFLFERMQAHSRRLQVRLQSVPCAQNNSEFWPLHWASTPSPARNSSHHQ